MRLPIIFALALLLPLLSCGPQDVAPEEASPQEERRVSVDALVGEFEANEVRAEQEYEGVRLVVSGEVTDVGRNLVSDNPVIEIADQVVCWTDEDSAAAVDVGDRVTVRGVDPVSASGVLLKKCELVE